MTQARRLTAFRSSRRAARCGSIAGGVAIGPRACPAWPSSSSASRAGQRSSMPSWSCPASMVSPNGKGASAPLIMRAIRIALLIGNGFMLLAQMTAGPYRVFLVAKREGVEWPFDTTAWAANGRTYVMKKGPAHHTRQPLAGSAAQLGGDHENHANFAAYSQRRLGADPGRCYSTGAH